MDINMQNDNSERISKAPAENPKAGEFQTGASLTADSRTAGSLTNGSSNRESQAADPRSSSSGIYDFWLSHLTFVPHRLIREMLAFFDGDPGILFSQSPDDLLKAGFIMNLTQMEQYESFRNKDRLEELRETYEKSGIFYAGEHEDSFPDRLRPLEDRPFGLFYKGSLPPDDCLPAGIVGSRTCTTYGREMAFFFGRELCKRGVSIISGMALGVDGYAQKGALASSETSSASTYAVLAGGVDICYPRENIGLYMQLSENGNGLLSEYPPGRRAMPRDFPVRNRIIAGLSDVLLVIEAAENSGSLITVNHALSQGKDVFALPGRVGERMASGCNELLKNGAQVLTCPEDVLQYLGIQVKKDTPAPKKAMLSREEKVVYECFGADDTTVDQLLEISTFPATILQTVLLTLEIKGLIRKTPFGGYRKV
ncbi:MAG: DNA-processing protein DprA [Lachnospiraceae bacterium]|nr:DNA-processing protein DprA [Lachnospiraceae bacterium]